MLLLVLLLLLLLLLPPLIVSTYKMQQEEATTAATALMLMMCTLNVIATSESKFVNEATAACITPHDDGLNETNAVVLTRFWMVE